MDTTGSVPPDSNGEVIESILREALRRGASDVFFEPDRPPQIRIDGKVVALAERPRISAQVVDGYLESARAEMNHLRGAKPIVLIGKLDGHPLRIAPTSRGFAARYSGDVLKHAAKRKRRAR